MIGTDKTSLSAKEICRRYEHGLWAEVTDSKKLVAKKTQSSDYHRFLSIN